MPKGEKKLIDIRGGLRRLGNKSHRFFLQKVLSVSRAILLVGGDNNPLFRDKFVNKCKSSCKIAGLSRIKYPCDLHLPFTQFSQSQFLSFETQLPTLSKLYESIILLPQNPPLYSPITTTDFLTDVFPQPSPQSPQSPSSSPSSPTKSQLALMTYKLANRFLTNSGVIILSGSEKVYFQEKRIEPGRQILNDQTNCVNLVLGERDYTDIDSQAINVLAEDMEIGKEGGEMEAVLEMYKNWSEGRELPFPGSFVKLVRKSGRIYPEFY